MPKCPFGKNVKIPQGCKKCLSFDKKDGCLKTKFQHREDRQHG